VRRAVSGILVAVGLAFSLSACDNVVTPVAPTETPTIVTETFTGDLVLGTINVHQYTAKKGVTAATLTSLTPLTTSHVGMSLGVWDGTTCTAVATNDASGVGSQVVGTATIETVNLCLRVYDIGNVPPDTTYSYTASVAHY
jgi:hypothetical protein